jgi:hypothetical protein
MPEAVVVVLEVWIQQHHQEVLVVVELVHLQMEYLVLIMVVEELLLQELQTPEVVEVVEPQVVLKEDKMVDLV